MLEFRRAGILVAPEAAEQGCASTRHDDKMHVNGSLPQIGKAASTACGLLAQYLPTGNSAGTAVILGTATPSAGRSFFRSILDSKASFIRTGSLEICPTACESRTGRSTGLMQAGDRVGAGGRAHDFAGDA